MFCVMRYNYYYFVYYHIYIIHFFKLHSVFFTGYLMGKKYSFFYLLIYIDCVIVSSKNKLNSHKPKLNQLKMHRSRHWFDVLAVIPPPS